MQTIDFETIDSTNTYLKNHYQEIEDFTFVSAKYQTSGRGRTNRVWKSENGTNLLFSLLIKEESLINKFKDISIISAYSLIEVLEKDYDIKDLSIKWPNDIFYQDYKICGILLEGVSTIKLDCVILGIGLNVNQKDFDNDLRHKASSLSNIMNKDVQLTDLKQRIYQKLEDNLNLLKKNYDFYESIVKYDYLSNKEVYADIDGSIQKIKVLGINRDYSLKIRYEEKERDLFTGEISFHL